MAKVISFVNVKGGSGKSTSVENVADALVIRGKRCLVIDADRQGSLTGHFLKGQTAYALQKLEKTLDYALLHDRALGDLIVQGEAGTPDFIGAWPSEDDDEIVLSLTSKNSDPKALLKKSLSPIREQYDYILIDTPGAINIMTKNAMVASDAVIIPVDTEPKALKALPVFMRSFLKMRKDVNPTLHIVGMLPTKFKRRNWTDRRILKSLQENWGERLTVFDPIYNTTKFTQVEGTGSSTLRLFPNAPGVAEYYKLADTLIDYYG